MSTPRLTFLYPHLFGSQRAYESIAAHRPLHKTKPQIRKARISTSILRKDEQTYAQRYGPAAEPQLPPPSQPPVANDLGHESLAGVLEKEVQPPAPTQEEKKAESAPSPKAKDDREASTTKPTVGGGQAQSLDASESHPKETSTSTSPQEASTKPLDTVLNRSTPTQSTPSEHKPPHLQAPPYVHHFDTYSIAGNLQSGGFTAIQSITLMKAIRILLAKNMEVAREGLVSKSDVENETYLFRAACSELRTEIANARRTSRDRTATNLSHLSHETDILSQRLSQESSSLRDSLRGMLDDRRMAVRMDAQAIDQKVQELNYKITVSLNSGSRSTVEGLRWVLTRRAVLAIAGMAGLILGTLRYTTYRIHVMDEERKAAAEKSKAEAEFESGSGGGGGRGGNFTVNSREMGTQTGSADTEAMLANVDKDGSPAYVSLG
ncbi:MAG: hypothetical protein Q9220_006449 [cf. Caloplaca sp. 1 TL-2023]